MISVLSFLSIRYRSSDLSIYYCDTFTLYTILIIILSVILLELVLPVRIYWKVLLLIVLASMKSQLQQAFWK